MFIGNSQVRGSRRGSHLEYITCCFESQHLQSKHDDFSTVLLWFISISSSFFLHFFFPVLFDACNILFVSTNYWLLLELSSHFLDKTVLPDFKNIESFKHKYKKTRFARWCPVTHQWHMWAAGPGWAWAATQTGLCTSSCSSDEACWR